MRSGLLIAVFVASVAVPCQYVCALAPEDAAATPHAGMSAAGPDAPPCHEGGSPAAPGSEDAGCGDLCHSVRAATSATAVDVEIEASAHLSPALAPGGVALPRPRARRHVSGYPPGGTPQALATRHRPLRL